MAKGKRNKAESAPIEAAGKSLLEVAWRAYEAGDSVLARRAANRVLEGVPRDADESAAKKFGKQLFVGGAETDAKQFATELVARTKAAPKPYLFALMALAIWLAMIVIANRG